MSVSSNSSDGESYLNSGPASVPTINSLPFEILIPIFESIPVPKRNGLRGVCKRWKDIMDSVGIEVRIGTLSQFDPFYEKNENSDDTQALTPSYQDAKVISEIGIESCIVGNLLNQPEDPEGIFNLFQKIRDLFVGMQETPIAKFKYPELVLQMQFVGGVSPVWFKSLVSDLPCLTSLTMHLVSFNELDESCFATLNLPRLETLVVKNSVVHDIAQSFVSEMDVINVLRNVSTMTKNTFPSLVSVSIDYVYDMDQHLEINKCTLEFLQNHSTSIKKFNLQYSVVINEDTFHGHVAADHLALLQIANELQGTLQLECLQIIPVSLPVLPFTPIWTQIIEDQKYLKILSVVGVLYRSDLIQRIVDKNFRTLTNICICRIVLFENQTPLPFDCRIFGPCENLRFLALKGWTITLSVKSLINVEALPKTLEQIDLGDMAVGTEDIRMLALEMPKLEYLELRFVGNKRDMGMDEDTLREIVRRRQIKTCFLQRAFNGKLGQDGIYNGDADEPDHITESMGGFIGFRKTKRGFYRKMAMNHSWF